MKTINNNNESPKKNLLLSTTLILLGGSLWVGSLIINAKALPSEGERAQLKRAHPPAKVAVLENK